MLIGSWGYRKVEDIDRFRDILRSDIETVESYMVDEDLEDDWEEVLGYRKEDYLNYLKSVEEGEEHPDPSRIGYLDPKTNEFIFYYKETYDQYKKRYIRKFKQLREIQRTIKKTNDYSLCEEEFIKNYDILKNTSLKYSILVKDGEVYYQWWNYDHLGQLELGNKYQILNDYIQFSDYSPLDKDDIFYLTSPEEKKPTGWTNAEDLIKFLEWYKEIVKKCTKLHPDPVCMINGETHSGYDEVLYGRIRELFNEADYELLVTFGHS